LGDSMDWPTQAARGSAIDRHSTAYRAIGIGNSAIAMRHPTEK
jgi:hypothetical protein